MDLREANYNDYNEVKKLHFRNNIKILDKLEWMNFWKKNPLINNNKNKFPIGWVLVKNNEIIGFLGNIVKEYYLKDKKLLVACSHAWVVDKKYRLNSFRLINIFFSQKNIDLFITSTPNKVTEKIFIKYGAKKLSTKNFNKNFFLILNVENFIYSFFKYFKKSINKYFNILLSKLFKFLFFYKINYWKKFTFDEKVDFLKSFNMNFEDFWLNLKQNNKKMILSKSPNWCNWHIKSFKNFWITTLHQNNTLKGYAVCCERNNDNYRLKRVSIIDVVVSERDQKSYMSLIGNSIKKGYELGYDIIDMIGTNQIKRNMFSSFKTFERKNSNFLFYYYSSNKSLMDTLSGEDIWDTTLFDGDNFIS